ncbi:MAG: DUF4097 family beta strand repeat protein [Spirochaetaceae bacterium]|nr:MAG: DUF4097 family beta strand repeat protein [Spirochaetaceae bacterium]
MRSRRTWVDVLGPVFGLLAAALIVYALVYLLWIEPFYQGESYRSFDRAGRGFTIGSGWESQEVTENVEGSFGELEIRNVSGPIRIEAWNQDYVQVHYIKQARSSRYLEEFEIEIESRGRRLSIRPVYRRIAGSPFGSVSFDLKVPSSIVEIRANNISGDIGIENMGPGVVQVLETVSGRIETERSADLRAKSISGSINFAFAGKTLDINATSGRVHGEILSLDPGGSVEIDTISGAVDLEVFSALDADLKLQSVSGSISCDFPVRVIEQKRTKLEGTVGDGTVPFEVKTVSGRISLSR